MNKKVIRTSNVRSPIEDRIKAALAAKPSSFHFVPNTKIILSQRSPSMRLIKKRPNIIPTPMVIPVFPQAPWPEIRRSETLNLRVMNGIGDLCWLCSVIGNMKKAYDIDKINIDVQLAGDHRDGRAHEFIERFDFIDKITTTRFNIHSPQGPYENRLIYMDQGYNAEGDLYTLFPNPWIEWGGRLEEMFPDVPIMWDIFNHFVALPQEVGFAENLKRNGTCLGQAERGYFCFHMGTEATSTTDGMNRGGDWSTMDWAKLMGKVKQISDLPIYIIGAPYDNGYTDNVFKLLEPGHGIVNLAGKTSSTQVVEVLKQATAVVGFPSGIPITSTYLGTPTVMFWRPEGTSHSSQCSLWFSDSFATNWVRPDFIGETYHPAWYGKDDVESVFLRLIKSMSCRKY